MRIINSAINAFIIIGASACLVSCNKKVDQLNTIIRTPIGQEGAIDRISQEIAVKSGMVVSKEVFNYGGKNGELVSILISNHTSSIVIRNISTEECTVKGGDRKPEFYRYIFSVSIYRTSIFSPKIDNIDLLKIISLAASRNGSSIVEEHSKCK